MTNIKITDKNFVKSLFLLFIREFTNSNQIINHKASKYIIEIIIIQLKNIIEGRQNNIINIFNADVLPDRTIKDYPKNIKLPPTKYMDSFMKDIRKSRFYILNEFIVNYLSPLVSDKNVINIYLKSFEKLKKNIISYLTLISENNSNIELKFFINTLTIKLFTDTTYNDSQIKNINNIFEKLENDILPKTFESLRDNNSNINTYVKELMEKPENNVVNIAVIIQLIDKFGNYILKKNSLNDSEKTKEGIRNVTLYISSARKIIQLL